MLFSVIINVRNGEKYIKEALDSALNLNTCFDCRDSEIFEVIVVENGSSDRTGQICDSYEARDKRVRVIHKGAIGTYSAKQVGIRAAKGDWIIALDADDILAPDMLKVLYPWTIAADRNGCEADVIFYDTADLDDRERILFSYPFEPKKVYRGDEKRAFYDVLCVGDSLNAMWTKCIRREMAYLGEEHLFLCFGEDLYQTVQYLDRARGIIYLKETLYYYRRTGESISFTFSDFYLDSQKVVWEMVDKISGGWNNPDYVKKITERKALTCSIVIARLIYSDLSISRKIVKYRNITTDPFYCRHYKNDLPAWAPEESVHIHSLQIRDDHFIAVTKAVVIYNIKMHVKKILKAVRR
ncbi:MAG: glycosyltransferase [Butyrivibrio sp.]|nr:glycosyltransferase [Butyrivibrio sp.]